MKEVIAIPPAIIINLHTNSNLASLDCIFDSGISLALVSTCFQKYQSLIRIAYLLPDLRLEVQINKLSLLWLPLAICVSVVDNLVTASVTDFNCAVREDAFGRPLELIALL